MRLIGRMSGLWGALLNRRQCILHSLGNLGIRNHFDLCFPDQGRRTLEQGAGLIGLVSTRRPTLWEEPAYGCPRETPGRAAEL
jgi:hypothetical protein